MKVTTVIAVLLVSGLSACDDTVSRLAHFEKVCEKAESIGQPDVAEDYCQRALGEAGEEKVLEPGVRSERLFRLARIKRQRAKFGEADELLKQSLAIEEALSGPESPEVARRLSERSLVLAGLGQWEAGAVVQERALYSLLAPVERVTGWDIVVPLKRSEAYHVPDVGRIVAAAHRTLEA